MALIELEHIVKTYDLGLSKVPALRDIPFSHRSAASSSPSSGSRGRASRR